MNKKATKKQIQFFEYLGIRGTQKLSQKEIGDLFARVDGMVPDAQWEAYQKKKTAWDSRKAKGSKGGFTFDIDVGRRRGCLSKMFLILLVACLIFILFSIALDRS